MGLSPPLRCALLIFVWLVALLGIFTITFQPVALLLSVLGGAVPLDVKPYVVTTANRLPSTATAGSTHALFFRRPSWAARSAPVPDPASFSSYFAASLHGHPWRSISVACAMVVFAALFWIRAGFVHTLSWTLSPVDAFVMAAVTSESPGRPTMPYRILALHGKWETAESFRETLASMRQELGKGREVEWTFIDAPHPVGDGKGGFAWWSLPPGVRSFQATEYLGFEESIKRIEDAWREQGPFDAIIGFSQGAILLSVLLGRSLRNETVVKPSKAILVGAAWPNPYGDTVRGLKDLHSTLTQSPLQTLHVYSMKDTMNPGAMAKEIAECYSPVAETWEHDGPHIVPQRPKDLQRYAQFLGL